MSDDWIQALEQSISNRADKVPCGFLTLEQVGTNLGLGTEATRRAVNKLKVSGLVKVLNLRVTNGRRVYRKPFFKLVKK
jgi:hypothetical protein